MIQRLITSQQIPDGRTEEDVENIDTLKKYLHDMYIHLGDHSEHEDNYRRMKYYSNNPEQ